MCGIWGGISRTHLNTRKLSTLARFAYQRGKDSSGYLFIRNSHLTIIRSDDPIVKLLRREPISNMSFFVGHGRLITNGLQDNQPILRDGIAVIHNGIIVNDRDIWKQINQVPKQQIDSEVIAGLVHYEIQNGTPLDKIPDKLLNVCQGILNAVVVVPELSKLMLISNNGSLFTGKYNDDLYFSSEKYPLMQIGASEIVQIRNHVLLDIPFAETHSEFEYARSRINLIPALIEQEKEHYLLKYENKTLRRCSICVLPETMPFIAFDERGMCNYCHNYKLRNQPKPLYELQEILERYPRKRGKVECIFPFSGGRDSSYGLHLAVKELGLKPIAFTYDWGMVTDLGRRNISRMCGELGIENIIAAADIEWKRRNIRKNLIAWLKDPDIGMLSILTAGDKHFFRHIERVKRQTGISLNIWSVNPLEVTHFKTGFLGMKPDFEATRVYQSGLTKQLVYQSLRFKKMLRSPTYFNASLIDTLSGEYYRSRKSKTDYFHLFDFWKWDEQEIDSTLSNYGWERAIDTATTWRIGDGTAAFYNYVTHRVAGFSEHDTFRSNQIREGDISRDSALQLSCEENKPRYENIRWYLDALGLPFKETIEIVNSIPRMSSSWSHR